MLEPASGQERGFIDWSAVLAGALVAAGAALVLWVLAGGLVLAALPLGREGGISLFWALLAGVAVLASMLGPYLLGGYVAGRMRRRAGMAERSEIRIRDGFNGLVVWGLGMLISGVFAMGLAGGAVGYLGNSVRTVIATAGAAVGNVVEKAEDVAGRAGAAARDVLPGGDGANLPSLDDLLSRHLQGGALDYLTDLLLRGEGPMPQIAPEDRAELRRQIAGILAQLIRSGEISAEDDGFLRRRVGELTGLAREQVAARVDGVIARAQAIRAEAQAKVDAAKAQADDLREAAEARLAEAKVSATGLLRSLRLAGVLLALAMVVSAACAAAAAWFAAIRGGQHRDSGLVAAE